MHEAALPKLRTRSRITTLHQVLDEASWNENPFPNARAWDFLLADQLIHSRFAER